jgi:hypothetical protein
MVVRLAGRADFAHQPVTRLAGFAGQTVDRKHAAGTSWGNRNTIGRGSCFRSSADFDLFLPLRCEFLAKTADSSGTGVPFCVAPRRSARGMIAVRHMPGVARHFE